MSQENGRGRAASIVFVAEAIDRVVDRFCDVARGPKDHSLRRLAAHPRLPFSASTLWRSVSILELAQRVPGLATAKHVGVTHVRAVLGLPRALQLTH